MDSNLYFTLATTIHWVTLIAVAFSATAAVLEAGKKQFDLFGVVIVAIAGATGGGTVRDLLLDRTVFWVRDQSYLLVAIGAALLTFFIARRLRFNPRLFLVPDAIGLAMFAVAGTHAALLLNTPWLVASFMGVITGVMGGILRDVLCNEEPLVFQGTLYATAAWGGSLLYIALRTQAVDVSIAAIAASTSILAIRLVAIQWNIGLPKFHDRQ